MRLYLSNRICLVVTRCLGLLLGLTIAVNAVAAPSDGAGHPTISGAVSFSNPCGLTPPVLTPSATTVTQGSAPVSIVATGCPGGIIQYFNNFGTPQGVYTIAPGGTISAPTSLTGTMIISALCSFSGCTSDVSTATITINPAVGPNMTPAVATPIPSQTVTAGNYYTYLIPSATFSDPNNDKLTLSVSGLPSGLSFNGGIIFGPLLAAGTSTITVTATNTKNLSTSTNYMLTILPAPTVATPFSITGVSTITCATLKPDERRVTFNPQYAGANGMPISFSVVNELAPTTNLGPYTLDLYSNNPTINLVATQTGSPTSTFSYNWLSACSSTTNTTPFSITGVTTVSCQTVTASERRLTFNPQYAGVTGEQISFNVKNETLPTTLPGPYTIRVYIDNPTIYLEATQIATPGTVSFMYNWLAVCGTPTPNTAPTVANTIPSQTATVGQLYAYTIPAGTFTDAQTPNNLALSVAGLPTGLTFTAPSTISGVPSTTVGSPFSVTVTATDPGSLSVGTTFTLSIVPATVSGTFAITGVTTVSCLTITASERRLTFNPRYAGVTGMPISFSVANEMVPTTSPGPYQLRVYTDNPTITLWATQTGSPSPASFTYNWLSICNSGSGRVGLESELTVSILGNPTHAETVEIEIRGAAGQPVWMRTVNASGHSISESSIPEAGVLERATVQLGQSTGLYFIQVNTPTQKKVVKMLKQ